MLVKIGSQRGQGVGGSGEWGVASKGRTVAREQWPVNAKPEITRKKSCRTKPIGMVQILGLSGNSPDLPHASTAGFSTPSVRLLLSSGRSLQKNSARIRVRGRIIARSYRKLAMSGPPRPALSIRSEAGSPRSASAQRRCARAGSWTLGTLDDRYADHARFVDDSGQSSWLRCPPTAVSAKFEK